MNPQRNPRKITKNDAMFITYSFLLSHTFEYDMFLTGSRCDFVLTPCFTSTLYHRFQSRNVFFFRRRQHSQDVVRQGSRFGFRRDLPGEPGDQGTSGQ